MKKVLYLTFLLFFIISCDKDDNSINTLPALESTGIKGSSVASNDCSSKIKGKLKNEKHRQLVKKYYDQNVKKDVRLNKLGKVEWNHVITIDNYKQVMSIVPITKNGTGNKKEVTHIFVLYSNWFGHQYFVFDKAKDRNRIKDVELFDDLFLAANFVFNCDEQILETRGGCDGIIEWLFGDGISCYDFGSNGNFFTRLWSAIISIFTYDDAGPTSGGGGGSNNNDWSSYFFFGYGYDNNSASFYSTYDGNGGGGGPNTNNADPNESYDPAQMQTLQNCVNNSPAIQSTVEQILNDFVTTPNIQNIVADKLMQHCNINNSITANELQISVAQDIIIHYLSTPFFKELAVQVIAEYKYLEKDWIKTNKTYPDIYARAKLLVNAYWNVIRDEAHVFFDMCGLIPAFGEICDLTNGVLYTVEGDYTNAAFSYAAMIPFYGWITIGAKYVAYAIKTASGKTVNLTVKLVGNIVDFGRSYDLRKALDLAIGNPLQAHHLIAWEYRGHQVIQE
ncbi:MAG: hypothetical protein WBP08_19200, partial [Saprospiraceae bacterium]